MIAVVVDVGGELRLVAPPDHALLAARRGPPVHFQLQLVGLDEARRVRGCLPEEAEKKEAALRLWLVDVSSLLARRPPSPRAGTRRPRPRAAGGPRVTGCPP